MRIKRKMGWTRGEGDFFDRLICLLLMVEVVILPVQKSKYFEGIIIGLLAFVWVAKIILLKQWIWRRTPLDLFILSLTLWELLSSLLSTHPHYSLGEFRTEVIPCFFFFYAAVTHIRERRDIEKILYALMVGSAWMASCGIYQFFSLGGAWTARTVRIGALASDFNYASTYFILVLPIIFYFVVTAPRWKLKFFLFSFLLLINFLALYLTFTRAAWLGGAVAVGILSLLKGRRFVLPVAAASGFIFIFLFTTVSGKAFYDRMGGDQGGRTPVWQIGVERILQNPIFGIGYGRKNMAATFPDLEELYKAGFWHLHNTFLETALETGIPGMLLLLILIGALIFSFKKGIRRIADSRDAWFMTAMIMIIFAYFTRNLFDHLYVDAPAVLFWLLMGLGISTLQTAGASEVDKRVKAKAKAMVLITNLDGGPHNQGDLFIESILRSPIRDQFELCLAVADPFLSERLAQRYGIRCHVVDLPRGGGMLGRTWRAIHALQKIYSENRFDLIHTHGLLDHYAACGWKLFYRPPVLVIRTRYSPERITDRFVNRLIHNRLTAVHIVLNRTTEESLRRREAGLLRVNNLCVLQDSLPLSKRGLEMLEHCYLSMTSPTRNHPSSGRIVDWSHIAFSYVIHFYFNQGDASPLLDLLRRYERYDPRLLDRIHFVIVDDGSPIKVDPPDMDLNFTWLRITEDIPWNQGGARNLAAVYAKSDSVLLSDLDIAFPEETLRAIAEAPPCGRDFYKFYMKDERTGILQKGHANTFLISRARFLRFGGYDEEFCGRYGAEDFRFVKFQKAQGSRQRYFNSKYTCFKRLDIDRSVHYHSLERDLSWNTPVDARKKFEMELFGHKAGHSRMFLNFTWEKVRERGREVEWGRKIDRAWERRWIWRWLFGPP